MYFHKRPDEPKRFGARALNTLRERVKRESGKITDSSFTSSVWRDKKSRFEIAGGKGKCGYCERVRDLDGECQVDHYRPRLAVSVFERDPSATDDDRPTIARSSVGYWWLAYQWSNLVLICPGCNSSKGSLFPVKSPADMVDGADLSNEEPWLLDPYDLSQRSTQHFRWTVSGELEAIDNKGRAVWSIAICRLNREGLVTDRSKQIKAVLRAIEAYRAALRAATTSAKQNSGRIEQAQDEALRRSEADLQHLGEEGVEFTGLNRAIINHELAARGLPRMHWE
jgi:5-methylcytosine-specific restriction endonuclease McrA